MDPSGSPSDVALASIGEPSADHRAALARRSARYGLALPPSPSTDRQTVSSARNRARRASASGSVASRARTVSRSIRSAPTVIAAAAAPYRRTTLARNRRTDASWETLALAVAAAPGAGSRSSSHATVPRMFSAARTSSPRSRDASTSANPVANARRLARYRRTRTGTVRGAPGASPRVLATTRSPNAARRSSKDCSTAAMSMRSAGYAPVAVGCHHASMHIQFLGGATTVTGSQFLLTTDRARILIDCGMFQGSPNESIRNRIPFAFDPKEIDAVLLTHAHLDHCGLLPLLVKDGYGGKIHATAGTVELATLVLLDSGKLHEEFAKREARWEKRHPDKVAADDKREADQYEAAMALAATGEVGLAEDSDEAAAAAQEATAGTTSVAPAAAAAPTPDGGEHVPTSIEPGGPGWPMDPEAQLRAQPPHLDID